VLLLTLGSESLVPVVATDFIEQSGRFHPTDSRWFAYSSNATGRREVYLGRFEGEMTPVRVSSDGGEHPQFRRDGRELFYLTPTDEIVAVDLTRLSQTGTVGPSTTLFRVVLNDIYRGGGPAFDVSADGQRFLLNVPSTSEPLTLIQGYRGMLGG
jgi:hypothetical protein